MLDKIQKQQIKNALSKLGLPKNEIAVYFSALRQGESTVATISEDSGLSRGTVYDSVEKLKTKGFLTETQKGKRRSIIVENPTNKFYSILDKQHKELNNTVSLVEDILPVINSINPSKGHKTQIRVYKGQKGLNVILDEIVERGTKEWLSIARMEDFINFSGEEYLAKLHKRKAKAGVRSRAIHEDSPLGRKLKLLDEKENRVTRLAPKEFKFPTSEIIYGEDKIAILSGKKENMVMIIESKDFAESQRNYFEMMWKYLEKNKVD